MNSQPDLEQILAFWGIEALARWEMLQDNLFGITLADGRRFVLKELGLHTEETIRRPPLHDPFAGGGAIPLEAQRLGLEAYASDLNPVAVLINKAMIEIPPKFAGRPPVSLAARGAAEGAEQNQQLELLRDSATPREQWPGATGLAEDVRYYGAWMREEAQKRIGHLYPLVEITAEMARERPDLKPLVGQKLTVIAWLWARTVKSPNPAFSHVDVPLVSSFILSSKEGKQAYVQPVVEGDRYYFMEARTSDARQPTLVLPATLWSHHLRRPLHPAAIGSIDDL